MRRPSATLGVVLLALLHQGLAIPLPNGQLGKAEVECGEDNIEVVFITENIFNGRIFVIGHSDDDACVSRDVGRQTTSISINKARCGAVTTRSTDPPGLFVNVKVMLSFHDSFITKGYEISCFYMEADKTVTYPLTVSMRSLEPFTELAEMPRCRYEVVDPVSMEPLSVVSVGNQLLHKWTCDRTDFWCMTVHSCFVEDGSGTQFTILKEDGCAVDRYLLDNLEYGPGELQAQKEAHAFKFADKVVVNFQCSVRLDLRDGDCPDLGKKQTRRVARSHDEVSRDVDVRAQQLDVLDPLVDFGLTADDAHFKAALRQLSGPRIQCLRAEMLLLPAALTLLLVLSMTVAIWHLARRAVPKQP